MRLKVTMRKIIWTIPVLFLATGVVYRIIYWQFINETPQPFLAGSSQKTNKSCVQKKVQLSKTSLPAIALASYPGSGNTWVRHLIQQMTGIGTSSVQPVCDHDLENQGFPFECVSDVEKQRTIVIKTHQLSWERYEKAVVIIRNPFKSILSFFNWKYAQHIGFADAAMLNSTEWTNHVPWRIIGWTDFYEAWLVNFTGPVHVIHYEQLKLDLVGELRGLVSFLGYDVKESDIQCAVQLQEGNFHRQNKNDAEQENRFMKQIYNRDFAERIKTMAFKVEGIVKRKFHKEFDILGNMKNLFSK